MWLVNQHALSFGIMSVVVIVLEMKIVPTVPAWSSENSILATTSQAFMMIKMKICRRSRENIHSERQGLSAFGDNCRLMDAHTIANFTAEYNWRRSYMISV